jgi:HAE1 family hydrophobic/amphiphilic exporter-1
MWLTSISIRRPVFILMVVMALIVLGLNSMSKMRLELNPKVDFPFVSVSTAYPGAGPEEIESQVSEKIEDAVASVNGVKTITSSSQEGVSIVAIEFNMGIPSDIAASDVREKVGSIRNQLPTQVREPVIQKFDVNSEPIIYYGLVGSRPSKDLRDLAENVIKPRLGQIAGVGAVNVTGGDLREISVAVRKDRLDAYGIPISDLVTLLRSNTMNVPVGRIIEGNREYSLRVVGEFEDVEHVAATRVRMPNGQTVRLSDIATVTDSVRERRDLSRIDRKDSVAIVIQKTSEGNTVDVAHGVKKEVEALKKTLPRDVQFVLNQDLSINVEESVADVKSSLFVGAFLAVLIVYLFLHNIRGTFIVAIAIPTSIVATFLVMYAFGFTLNTMTLLALSLSVGILVDDSIVVLENIYRHLGKGEDPIEASLNGRGEIGLAAITITLVDVVVFVPIAFMGGIVGQFFKAYGITVATATLFSLFMSFTLTPMLASRWYRTGDNVEVHSGFFGAFNRFYGFLDRVYRRVLETALRYRGVVVYAGTGLLILVFAAIASSFSGKMAGLPVLVVLFVVFGLLFNWRYKKVGLLVTGLGVASVFVALTIGANWGKPMLNFRFAPEMDQGQVSVEGELAAGTALATTSRIAEQVEEVVDGHPDVEGIFTSVGQSGGGGGIGGFGGSGTQYFSMRLKLREKMSLGDTLNPMVDKTHLRKKRDTEVADEIRTALGQMAGVDLKVSAMSGFRGGAPLQVDLQGRDMAVLNKQAEEVLKAFKEEPGVLNADLSSRIGKPEQQIRIDRDKAADFGLSVAQISQALRTSIEGDPNAVVLRQNGNEYGINVHFGEQDRRDVNAVGDIVVGSAGGVGAGGAAQPVRLRDVADIRLASGPTQIDRQNRERLVSVTANTAPGFAPGNMQLGINKRLERINFGSTQMSWGGENKTQAEEGQYMGAALGLAIILVYMLMAALFDNLLYPFIIMLSLPQAMIGALLALIVAGQALSIMAMIGVIMLVGLVSKNAILLVDYTNTLRERGYSRTDAILEAGPTRLRPILMTTIAMVAGMLPVALALGRGGEFRAPVATTIIGGLILSTFLTLLVIPAVYTYFDDFTRFIGRRVFRRRLEPVVEEERLPAGVS